MSQTRRFMESTWVIKLLRDFLYNIALPSSSVSLLFESGSQKVLCDAAVQFVVQVVYRSMHRVTLNNFLAIFDTRNTKVQIIIINCT